MVKLNTQIMILILVGQLVAHIGDLLINDFKNFGVILMVTIVAHLLNGADYALQEVRKR